METEIADYQQSLTQAGLTSHQAAVYEALIKNGALPARTVGLKSGLSRPLAYKILDELEALGLAEKHEKPRAVAKFAAAHPLKLKEIADKRFEAAQGAKQAMEGTLGKLISDFNLQSGKPGVQFFEGLEGIKKVLDDSLTSTETIYAYSDLAAIAGHIPDINKAYVAERMRRNINKRGLVPDTPENRAFMTGYKDKTLEMTETRFLPLDKAPFSTVMQIYDNKVSYSVLGEKQFIGVIIADPHVYKMHRILYDYLWSITPPIDRATE